MVIFPFLIFPFFPPFPFLPSSFLPSFHSPSSISLPLLSSPTPFRAFVSLFADTLKVGPPETILTSPSIWGIYRGLETFSQLVFQNPELGGEYQIKVATITDYPRFSHRGVLLDSSRHFLEKKVILQNLDAMAYNKFNVFHWHIVDDQSFPYQSRDFSGLSDGGAYNKLSHVYSQADVAEIIEYARLRGIRVIPEFDSPGHTQSWGPGQPGLLTQCYKDGKPTNSYGPVDPSKTTTYDFLQGFIKEITEVFPDQYVHLGGDEVSYGCWQSNPDITAFMKQQNITGDYSALEQLYMQRILDITHQHNSDYIIWQEVIDNGCKVQPNTVVEVWKGGQEAELAKVTSLGYNTILSSCWYLNRISYGTDWHPFYACDPHNFNGTAQQKKLVIGGEMCMWGEWVDATNLISRLWPRGSAVGERLWSAASVTDVGEATERMQQHRCRMIQRGLTPEPINGPSFCDYEYKP